MFTHNGLKIVAPIEINNIIYSLEWLAQASPEQLIELNITDKPDPITPDPALYSWTENDDGSLTVTPLTAEQIASNNAQAFAVAEQHAKDVVQAWMETIAQAHGYDNLLSACSYGCCPNRFQTESMNFTAWRASVWDTCYTMLAQVQAGTLAIPTDAELIALLPVFV